jgi:hypothetical protein
MRRGCGALRRGRQVTVELEGRSRSPLSCRPKQQAGIRTSVNYARMLMPLALRVWQVPARFVSRGHQPRFRTRNGLSPSD